MNNQTLLILQGLPGCGKSTYAKQWQAESPTTRVIVSRDALRHSRGVYWIPQQETYITELETFAVNSALDMGYDVCVDATNLSEAYINRWRLVAQRHAISIEFKLIEATLEECIERDKNQNREHHVGEAVIRQFYNKYNKVKASKND